MKCGTVDAAPAWRGTQLERCAANRWPDHWRIRRHLDPLVILERELGPPMVIGLRDYRRGSARQIDARPGAGRRGSYHRHPCPCARPRRRRPPIQFPTVGSVDRCLRIDRGLHLSPRSSRSPRRDCQYRNGRHQNAEPPTFWPGVVPIWKFGTEEQKNRYLPGLCDGTLIAANAMSEPKLAPMHLL